MEHLRNPEKVLAEIKNFLIEDGVLISSIPNIANWSVRLNLLFGNFDYTSYGLLDKTHLKFYTLRNAKNLICNNNYKIDRIYYSTSLVNILYEKVKKSNSERLMKKPVDNMEQSKKKNKFSLRFAFKNSVEFLDKVITNLFPRLFAYQFIIVAKPKII